MSARRHARPVTRHAAPALVLAGLGLAGLAWATLAHPTPRLIWNPSPSAPIGLYRLDPDAPIVLGAGVAYRPTPQQAQLFARRHYLPDGLPLLKTVAAVAPSKVCREGLALSIDAAVVARARSADRAGRPLPVWSGCRNLAPDQVFLLTAQAPDSLDGRYFGPVSRTRIIGPVTLLWRVEPVR